MTDYQTIVDALAGDFRCLTSTDSSGFEKSIFTTASASWAVRNFAISPYEGELRGANSIGFVVPVEHSGQLVQLAKIDADLFDFTLMIVSANIAEGTPLPAELRAFAFEILQGKIERPTPPHRATQWHFPLSLTIFHLLTKAIQIHGLKMTRNDESPALSACDAVSEALAQCGQEFSFSQLKDLCVSSRKHSLRKQVQLFWLETKGPKALFLNRTVEQDLKSD
ncbi:hypothetical protein [Sulfitobacter mediterraneus]|uniref:hypothetical protein n=1 Tax=Sulfitobacter mediterraneus TaxID=83219 RepID=UPI0021A3ABA9|nr:hypothetical protein [Sulfitobacter mediterraneus]UWR10897.1 hypothetical protein K3753_16855 [Sulfitobacter mediterraneus]